MASDVRDTCLSPPGNEIREGEDKGGKGVAELSSPLPCSQSSSLLTSSPLAQRRQVMQGRGKDEIFQGYGAGALN